jgi:hypothetical protein
LTATLSVEGPDVVINDTRWLLIDMFVEDLTAEEWYVVLSVHGPVERYPFNKGSESGKPNNGVKCPGWMITLYLIGSL